MGNSGHFCTCTNFDCQLNPKNHSSGCDLCIKDSLEVDEIPTCFFRRISADISDVKEFTFESFVDFFLTHKDNYLQRKNR